MVVIIRLVLMSALYVNSDFILVLYLVLNISIKTYMQSHITTQIFDNGKSK